MIAKSAVAGALALVPAWLMPAAAHADVAAGARMALQWCSYCHVIGGATPETPVPQGPPTFHTIAHKLDRGQLRAFLSHPHGKMPDLALTRAEIDDLIDYIESLK